LEIRAGIRKIIASECSAYSGLPMAIPGVDVPGKPSINQASFSTQ
jgi:hypothetical protein